MTTGPAIVPGPLPFAPGTLLTDPAWLAERVGEAQRFWRTRDPGIAATLWWYSGSVVLLRPAVAALVETGSATSVLAADQRLLLTPLGYLDRVVTDPAAAPAGRFGAHLDDALTPILEPLAAAGGVPLQRLWALAADALGNRLLAEVQRATAAVPDPAALTDLAGSIAEGSAHLRPSPSFDTVGGGAFLHRGSCCMLYRLPGQELCISCPRQQPADRQRRLEAHARSM